MQEIKSDIEITNFIKQSVAELNKTSKFIFFLNSFLSLGAKVIFSLQVRKQLTSQMDQ